MLIERKITEQLLAWKNRSQRKVLLLRGARQVGKTFIVRKLGQTFNHFVEINLVEQTGIKNLFSGLSLDPNKILESISAFVDIPIIDGKTLIFIDEIQASPEAITALRFFFEKRPHLHIIATGSLLEFALEEIASFGVGRIEYLYMYPVTFQEFLISQKGELLLEQIKKATPAHPLPDLLHHKSLALLKTYLSLGGMPEILSHYGDTQSLNESTKLMQTIITGYEDDFPKYKKRFQSEYLRETLRSSALQVGKKFIYSHAFRDASSKVVHQALDLIVKAGLVHKVYHTAANGIPLGSEIDLSKFKTLPIDIGLYNRLTGLSLSDLALIDPLALISKGTLAEAYCGLELLWNQDPHLQEALYYWHRESKSSNAEVDYVVQVQNAIIPVEVKSSGKGAMHSMRMFLKEKHTSLGVRISTENFARYDNIVVIPLYAVSELHRVINECNNNW